MVYIISGIQNARIIESFINLLLEKHRAPVLNTKQRGKIWKNGSTISGCMSRNGSCGWDFLTRGVYKEKRTFFHEFWKIIKCYASTGIDMAERRKKFLYLLCVLSCLTLNQHQNNIEEDSSLRMIQSIFEDIGVFLRTRQYDVMSKTLKEYFLQRVGSDENLVKLLIDDVAFHFRKYLYCKAGSYRRVWYYRSWSLWADRRSAGLGNRDWEFPPVFEGEWRTL